MTTDMKPSKHWTGPRWLLLCLLVLGAVSMHHFVPPTHHEPAASVSMAMDSAPPHQPDSPAHDLPHLCMAILDGFLGLLLLVLLLLAPLWHTRTLAFHRLIRRPERPPDLSGRALLSSVCVLRL